MVTEVKTKISQWDFSHEEIRCESALITGIRPEASRSSPGQSEVLGNQDGSSLPVLICKSLG